MAITQRPLAVRRDLIRIFGEDRLVVERDLEASLRARDEIDAFDDGRPPVEQFVRQTDGPGDVVSGNAELDTDAVPRIKHASSLAHRRRFPA